MAENPRWVEIQKKAFTRWMNQYLSHRKMKAVDLQTDLATGVLLINLMEIISAKPFPKKWAKDPKNVMQKNENLNNVLGFIQSEGLKLVNIGSGDIAGGNIRIILGLIWTLILRYQIQSGFDEGSPKYALLEWVKRQVKPYGVTLPTNFTTSWTDGQVICALTDSLRPGALDMKQTDADNHPLQDIQLAMDTAHREYNIEPSFEAHDMNEDPDELAMMTYVSYFRDWLEKEALRQKQPFGGNTTAEGPGVEGGHAKKPAPFRIITRTRVNRQCVEGGAKFNISIQSPGGPLQHKPIQDNGDGTYDSEYFPQRAGHYTVSIQLEIEGVESEIKGSPFSLVFKGAVPENTWADGPGLVGGKTGHKLPFTIHGVDSDGKPTQDGDEDYKVVIRGPSGEVHPDIHDKKNGEVDVTYVAENPGDYHIDVLLSGVPIKDSPFTAKVKAAPDASKSWAEGPGLNGTYQNVPTHFTVHARDAWNHPVSGDDLKVTVEGHGHPDIKTHDNGDGTYSVNYTVDTPGQFVITATLDGDAVKNTPVTVKILENPDASNTSASGPGVEGGFAKKRNPFVITTKNTAGEQLPLKDAPHDAFHVSVHGPAGDVPIEDIVNHNDGTYSSAYSPEKHGDYKVDIKLYNAPIQGSPFHLVIEGANAGNTYAEGPGLVGGKTGRDLPFTIFGVDADGHRTTDGGEPYDVKINGPNGAIHPKVHDNGDGTVNVVYVPDVPGDYHVDVSLRGKHIKDAPFTAHVKAAPDASKSWAEGPGLHKAYDNEPAVFTVNARDQWGNPVSGDECTVTVVGPSPTSVNIVDNGDGTYTVTYNVEDEGKFVVTAKLDGDVVKNTPAEVDAILGADADNCAVAYTLTVHARDRRGNPKTYGGDRFTVQIKGPADSDVDSEAIDNGDGTYSAKYKLEGEPGSAFAVHIKLNDRSIKGSPFHHKL